MPKIVIQEALLMKNCTFNKENLTLVFQMKDPRSTNAPKSQQ